MSPRSHQLLCAFAVPAAFTVSRTGATSLTMPPPPPVERKPSYIQFTPKRSIPSFENLVALANYEERLKDARKIVWRDRGELPVEIHDLWECFKHATRGGLSELNPLMSLRASKPHNNQLRGWLSRVHNPCGGESDLALDEIKTNQEVRHTMASCADT